jgi:hypothetical protein
MLKKKGLITSLMAILGLIGLGWHIYVSKGLGVADVILLMTSIGLFAVEDPKFFKKGKLTKSTVPELPEEDDEDSPA